MMIGASMHSDTTSEATPGGENVMAGTTNTFKGARTELFGSVRGVDECGHLVFAVVKTDGGNLYGEFFEVGMPENDNDFNVEVGEFGFTDPENVGNPHPGARRHFSVEECATAEVLVRKLLSDPDVVLKRWRFVPGIRFLGGVTFRPGWIICDSSEH
jgi:hypothetical protein